VTTVGCFGGEQERTIKSKRIDGEKKGLLEKKPKKKERWGTKPFMIQGTKE